MLEEITAILNQPINQWEISFDERQRKQILWARIYAKCFSHGANGHNDLLIIAKMARLLDERAEK